MGSYSKAWLSYGELENRDVLRGISSIILKYPDDCKETETVNSACCELKNGLKGYLGRDDIKISVSACEKEGCLPDALPESYRTEAAGDSVIITGSDGRGVLYGTFSLLRDIGCGKDLDEITSGETVSPSCPLRMLNHWDNMDGSIERGYSGNSFFFRDDEIIVDERITDYARLVSSVGINAVVINNVNVKGAASYLITDRYFDKVSELCEVLSRYGIDLYLSLNFASPMEISGMDTVDPLDEGVKAWWEAKFAEVYRRLPKLGGFLVKADSEGRPGPFTYGRTQADGANMLARAIKPYGAKIIWRCFVYNCTQDWRDTTTDRARAAYDNFKPTDGDYEDNVILQIKNGPMDFQIREPVTPLFGALEKTNQMLEVQIAQEYTGHQIDLCYLMTMFREVLDFHTGGVYLGENDTVSDIITGAPDGNRNTGIAAVANTGDDYNWTGNDLAAANLYGFGRLAFDISLSAPEIAGEWIKLTFGASFRHTDKLCDVLVRSRGVYEKYTTPMGIGWMVEPGGHYGPNVDGYEYSRWGTYHRADLKGIGVDRSDKGTGYVLQYQEENARMYNDPATCPEELLLFFHHVPYDHVMKDGRTLLQYWYDCHFEGCDEAQEFVNIWESMKNDISDSDMYERVLERFKKQAKNACEWRDQVNTYFKRKSGIPDGKGRKIYE